MNIKKRIGLKRKDQLNKKLALQIIFSILLVAAVIITKQFNTNVSKEFISIADEQVSESIEPGKIKGSVISFLTGIADKMPIFSKDDDFAAPVSGTIYQKYGLNKNDEKSYYNHGMVIMSNTEAVKSISKGKVAVIGKNEKLSNYIVIESEGKTIIYGKINESFVKEGDTVAKGDIIGSLSSEEKVLHLEIWEDGQSVNPASLFKLK
jgi:septal ring factor EnvC (AmiA/AmiB activator)